MKQVFSLGGKIVVEDIPSPACGDNEVIVRNCFSVVSTGTEGAVLKQSGEGIAGLVSRAKDNPELVHKALDLVKKEGLGKAIQTIRGQTSGNLIPLGYSSSGTVLEIGRNISDIAGGDRVACAGAGRANHAEVVAIPRNLVCRIPDSVDFEAAAFTTIGAIAMQGVRRAQVQVGDRVAVIGLGLLGQLTCRILGAAGASVIGIDINKERVDLAIYMGAQAGLVSGKDIAVQVRQLTDGFGADAVIICAATADSAPVRQAMQMARQKGKVVAVGAVGMDLERGPFYEKELDFLISTSSGPGRYDAAYEEKGIDYPIGYVRWTENRNMQAFLNLLATKKIQLQKLTENIFPVEAAAAAYAALSDGADKPLAVILKYAVAPEAKLPRSIALQPLAKVAGRINVGVIGAGSFARAYHLPNLKRLPSYKIRAIVNRTGSAAKDLAEKYGAQYCSTDYREILADKETDMVLIATRHNLHATLIVEAARAGKHIFVEKPIALTYEECGEVYKSIKESRVNLAVGFNRRFSPLAQKAKTAISGHHNPLLITYRVNAAGLKKEHWLNDPFEGGGAILGEGCHFFDFVTWMVGAEPKKIYAGAISAGDPSLVNAGNVVCNISFNDGSIASLVYSTLGHETFPKERVEIFADNGIAVIDDFRELTLTGMKGQGEKLGRADKGHFGLLQEYARFLNGASEGRDLPGVMDGIRATFCALKALEAIKTGQAQDINVAGFLATA